MVPDLQKQGESQAFYVKGNALASFLGTWKNRGYEIFDDLCDKKAAVAEDLQALTLQLS